MVVVDASVAVKWVLTEDHSDHAKALTLGRQLFAPSFWFLEAGSVIWKRHRKGEFSSTDAGELLSALRAVGVRDDDAAADVPEALMLAAQLAHPIYDCLYLAVALRVDMPLITADDQFIRALASHPHLADRVRHVKDHQSEGSA